ncbi:hypothetical protein NMG60_11014387 [Bertholletia excelsa]
MTKICMNEACQATATLEWKKGWSLKSGGFATLCHNCGTAYENLVYCETFHLEESGWRECRICGKRIHCGCIVSKYMHDYLDFGGVGCVSCATSLETHSLRPIQIPNGDIHNGFGLLAAKNMCDLQSSFLQSRMSGNGSTGKGNLVQLKGTMDSKELSHFPQAQKSKGNSSIGQTKELLPPLQQSVGSTIFSKPENIRPVGVKDMYEPLSHPSLNFSLTAPLDTSNSLVPSPAEVMEGREQCKISVIKDQRVRQILPKLPKTGPQVGSEANKGMASQTRVARPPGEGRGRNQLLSRYWPRITDQELQKISGHLNSTIVPLFEKVLSASDAGRIGRLVLPKACAEAYFPPISQSDGVPIKIQDITGKEWTFQFRFWPNNNSRMYVLEGVTPCIQNMQLQAGDTVIFSRLDPGGKLVMGFRKASNTVDTQEHDTQISSSIPNGAPSRETSLPAVNDNLTANGGRKNEESSQRLMISERKRARNIGSKSKRLLIHSEDAMELRLTWEEAQELLRPSPSAKPTVVMIEDQEIEEYDEPPVFGKRTLFTARRSGEQEQWAQCDSCSKWRRLPADVLLPPRWTCSENIWDLCRCSCSAPDEITPEELASFVRVGKESKKRRIRGEIPKVAREHEPSGLDALATAAVLGDGAGDSGEPSSSATTKHPRHRPGCTCIVCIQPPSGKGKHKPTCICNVCMTVKRRFKTLMLRRKRRQSEREAEIARGKECANSPRDNEEKDGMTVNLPEETESWNNNIVRDVAETSKGQLDLNCHPNREDDMALEGTDLSMTSLLHAASLPLEMYMRENGLTNLDPSLPSQSVGESKSHYSHEQGDEG